MIIGKITPVKNVYELPSVAKLVRYYNINEYFWVVLGEISLWAHFLYSSSLRWESCHIA